MNIFTLPAMSLKGVLTGFSSNEGLCSDNKGDIWVVQQAADEITKISRTGTVLGSVSSAGYGPIGACSVDPSTGNLAVSTFFDASDGPAQILVYAGGSGTPTVYGLSGMGTFYYVAYDNSGNLYTDGCATYGYCEDAYELGELPAGSSSMHLISVAGGTISFPGPIQWSKRNNYLNAFDQLCGGTNASCANWISISGSAGTITGKTGNFLNYNGGQTCDLVTAVVAPAGERFIAGGDYDYCTSAEDPATAVYRWPNPAGGTSTNHYSDTSTIELPLGTAISGK